MNLLSIALLVFTATPIAEPYHGPIAEPYQGPIALAYVEQVPIVEVTHTAKPTVKPMLVAHSVSMRMCPCPMCRGQHLRNMHGCNLREAERNLGRNFTSYHRKLHATQPKPEPKKPSGCAGGQCYPQRRGWLPRLRRW